MTIFTGRSRRVRAAIVIAVALAAIASVAGTVLATRTTISGDTAASGAAGSSGAAVATRTDEEAVASEPVDETPLDHASARYGPDDGVRCPADAVRPQPNVPLQQALDEAGVDGIVCIPEGRHRLTATLRPLRGSTLIFEPGAVLDGSRRVTDWKYDGDQWFVTDQRQNFDVFGVRCTDNPAACLHEDVFVDGRPLERVLNGHELRSGAFYFDEAADTIYIVDDPSGHDVNVVVTETAINAGGVHDVTVRNATIERFGKHGIVTSDGWVVADSEIRYVHSHGLRAFGATRAEGNHIHHTGQMGIFAEGDGLVFEGNQLAYNNYLNFDLWHAGATKITDSARTVVRNNWSHHNNGDGWWFDWDNTDMVVENNLFEHNERSGLFVEASFRGTITTNIFRNNATSVQGSGAGLWISASKDVDVSDNLFDDNARSLVFVSTDRGASERYGTRETVNLLVQDNTFVLNEGYVGVAYGRTTVFSPEANNRFIGNDYVVADLDGEWWRWGTPDVYSHDPYDWEQWNKAGQDDGGTITAAP